jgi:pilus assembly protein FimV
MGHSRITLATLLALSLLNTTSASAEEASRDPFFVELKGPDEPASQVTRPTQPVTPVQRQAQPVRSPQPIASLNQGGRRYGPVRSTDTLWSLASKHRPSSRISVYQTMVAIYDKNPASFADGNINHILVGSSITLPSEAEARRHTDAQARQRFNSDNASWKGLSPKYLASKQSVQPQAKPPVKSAPKQIVKPASASAAPIPVPVVAPVLAAAATPAKVPGEVSKLASGAQTTALANVASGAPAPLPVATETVQGKPVTEMALALEDANAQLGQVTEMNHRLKMRLQSLTEEVETLKAQLQDQLVLQKEVAELRANPVPPVAVAPPAQNWLTDLLASPLNLAMIILLPVLLVLALVTLWLRARARRELEEQEKNLSETTSVVMGQEMSEFDQLIGADIDEEPVARAVPAVDEAAAHRVEPDDLDLVFSDEGEQAREAEMRDPELVPELDLAADEQFERPEQPEMDLASEFNPAADQELMSEEELQAALFADLNAELDAEEDRFAAQSPEGSAALEDDELPELDFSDLDTSLDDEPVSGTDHTSQTADELLAEWGMSPEPAKDPNELALADFEDAFAEVEPGEELKPRAEAAADDFVEIDSLLADANANQSEQEPYQGFSLNVGLDGFPEVLPESDGFDVDADDGGVGAKLDLARAYLEIDDKESARELLVEASEQGNDKQRNEAEKLLKRLA